MPATAKRRLFVNWINKTLQASDRDGGPIALPFFNKYETVPFEVVILQPDVARVGLAGFSRLDITPLSLSMAINQTFDSAATLAYQPVFAKDETENVFSGELALNTALLNAYLGAADSKPAYFEIEMQEGTARNKILTIPITLQNAVTQVGAIVPGPVDEYLTKAQMFQQFVPKLLGPGETITFTTPDGLNQRVLGAGNGQVAIDQWFTV